MAAVRPRGTRWRAANGRSSRRTAKRARIERLLAEETELGAYFEEVNRLDAT
jgi:hypothetical protein